VAEETNYGSNSQQYKISKADVTADRFSQDKVIDIANIIVEVNLFEDIDKPYITGSLVLVDDSAILDTINFSGTETILIEMQGVDDTKTLTLQRKFIITSAIKSVRNNDRTEVFVLSLIDVAGYNTHSKRISKSYSGKIEDIIQGIIVSELGVSVDRSYAAPSIQAPVKVIVPYLHPLQACVWLRDKITRSNGSPYFVYASIHDENIRIGDFDTMMSQVPFNSLLPYHYSSSTTNAAERAGVDKSGNKEVDRAFTINTVTKTNMENTLAMIKRGAVGSTYSNTDISGGLTKQSQHKIEVALEQLKVSDVIKSYQQQNVYDTATLIDLGPKGKELASEHSSRQFHEISSSNTYATANSLGEDFNEAGISNKAMAECIHSMLYKNAIDIEIPGTAFMVRAKVSVGDVVNISFLNGNVGLNPESGQDIIDKNRSGDYLILATRHMFKDTTHTVSVNISKIARGSLSDG
jgi:hypothetical protein